MGNKIHSALDEIRAETQLKVQTYAFLQEKAYGKRPAAFRRLIPAMASVFVLLIASLFTYNLYFTESTIIDIDVNPGIEITLNRFNRVIGAYAYNSEGERVLSDVEIRHKGPEKALKTLVDKMVELGYTQESELFVTTLQTKRSNQEETLLQAVQGYIETALQADGQEMAQEIFTVDGETKTHAHEQNLSPAKYLAILELQAVDPTATFEACRNHSVGELRQQTHGHAGENHNASETETEGHGAGHGHK